MNKKLVLILVAISIMAMLGTMALAPQPHPTVRLVSAFISRGQFVSRFVVTGFAEKTSFHANYSLGANGGGMGCSYDGYRNVWCVGELAKKVHKQPLTVWLNGYVNYSWIP